jgi:hypothetical protein
MITEGHDRAATMNQVHPGEKFDSVNIPQEKGMRLHYDQTLPKILSELTGQKGEPVEFGEHQNAVDNAGEYENVGEVRHPDGRIHPAELRLIEAKRPRKDLIFKNADGTPKTSITARMYPLTEVAKPLSMLNKRKSKVSGIEDNPNFKKWFEGSKVTEPVYHASKEAPTKFDDRFKSDLSSMGFHFGTKEQAAFRTTQYDFSSRSPSTGKYYLSIKNPLDVSHMESFAPDYLAEKLIDMGLLTEEKFGKIRDRYSEEPQVGKELVKILKKAGYDGLKYPNEREGEGFSYVPFEPTQIKSATGNEGTFDGTNPDIRKSKVSGLLKSDIDKVKALGENGKVFGDTAEQFLEMRTENIGKFTTPLIRELRSAVPHSKKPAEFAKEIWSNDNPTFQRVVQYFDDLHDGKTPAKLGSAEQRVADIWRKYSELVYNERAKRGELHQGEKNTNYLPQTVNKDTIDRFKNPAEHKKLLSELTSYYKSLGRSADEAKENFDAIIAGYSKQEVNTAEQFGPLDKAHGIGLPKNWRETNLLSRVAKYMDRSGRRFAYYDTFDQLENKKEILDSVKVNDNAKAILREIHGTSAFHEPEINAITGLVKSFMLGPLTGSVDLINSHTLGFQHQQNPIQSVKAWWNSWKNVKQGWKDSYQTGRNRINFNALEWDEASDITDSIRRVRDIVGEVGGRNILEKITRARVMAEGRFLATDYLNQQAKGSLSKQGHKFFNDFGKNIDWKSGKLGNDEILKLAARYVDSVQGTYDPRGTDFRVREGALGPYLSLSRWSIEKLNNYNKHVIGAAAEGNWTPLLMSTLGMFIGGSAVNYLRETITKRKQKTAEWKELAAAKAEGEDIKADVLYKLAGLASASAYAGMLGDITKAVMDTAYGKNKAQTPNNVLIEAADNLVSTIASGFKGAADNGITPELFIDVVAKALEDNVQAYRVALAHLSDAKGEDIERQNKQRDLRTYNTIAGNPITDLTGEFITPMGNRDAKKFKKTDDIGEAAELVPSLIEDAIKKAKGNPDLLKKNLTALKQNSYQTMPNPETMPTTFLSYITYLEKSQGSQAATARLQDYLKRNAINKAKASMIP